MKYETIRPPNLLLDARHIKQNNMNQELWNKILTYEIDNSASEYGFSVRLAHENNWTENFTKQAILEYKKFMYLAASNGLMVSPSEIVDIVWHQHLIFTQSYQGLCDIIGKQIHHIPSTHAKEEYEKFKIAKERTRELYKNNFGQQPHNIWIYNNMFDILNLEEAKLKIQTFIPFAILIFIILTFPAYYLLADIYSEINNPYFIIELLGLSILFFIFLEIYNSWRLRKIVSEFDDKSFIYDLSPRELIYSQTQNLTNTINGLVNDLIISGIIKINSNYKIELISTNCSLGIEHTTIISTIADLGKTYYSKLLSKLLTKPIFVNAANCMVAFQLLFINSKKFGYLFYTNFITLGTLLLLSFTRVLTGFSNDIPVKLIIIFTILLTIVSVIYLKRLYKLISTKTIPNLYRDSIIPSRKELLNHKWKYFLRYTAVLVPTFIPIANNVNNLNNSGNCGSSCGSSCGGSSCSSCGGCGGGD